MTMENEKNKGELHIDIYIDIEEYAKVEKPHPVGHKKYLIKIDKALYKVEAECLTGKEILVLADKKPEKFQLNMKSKGAVIKKIDYDEKVCFSKPGIERFMTLPLDQTEG